MDGFDGLRTWLLSLPFVDERSGNDRGANLREFVIDCPPLGIWRSWLMIRAGGSDVEVLAVIMYANRDDAWGRLVAPRASSDARQLESVLILAYESAFAGCAP